MTVTYSRKRYIAVCVGCDGLFETVRKDQMTCSTACRVKAHRTGALQRRRELAESMAVAPGGIGHADAILRLRPDLETRITAGKVTIEGVMPEIAAAFSSASMAAARKRGTA